MRTEVKSKSISNSIHYRLSSESIEVVKEPTLWEPLEAIELFMQCKHRVYKIADF